MKERLLEIMGQIFNVPAEQLDENSTVETVENWDSLRHMNLVFTLEEEFGLKLPDEALAELTSVGQILEILEQKSN